MELKIIIVDDHQILVDGIYAMLQGVEAYCIVGKFNSGADALTFLANNEVDILLTDLNMPLMSGLELTQRVKKNFPHVKIIALSVSYDAAIVHELIDIGISGFILKTIGRQELVEAIREVSKGNVYYSREVSNEILRGLSNRNSEEEGYRLTEREVEILKYLSQEYSNADIAKKLFISERTVETHRKNIYRKTNTKTIVGLIRYAVEHKII